MSQNKSEGKQIVGQLTPTGRMPMLKQYLGDGTDFNVTGTDWTTIRAVAIPYQTIDGAWRLKFNIAGSQTPAAATLYLTLSGTTFKDVSNYEQAILVTDNTPNHIFAGFTNPGASTIKVESDGTVESQWRISGDVELESKPTWVD
ncbi:MAG: hypothetical protein MI892_17385 [Desulfobacterales bacterium]|nr:hypothetical protein [Desulfobacterales bacterium]